MSFQLNNLMKQAQEMQKKMQDAQKEIEEMEEDGESGGGAVKAVKNGKNELVSLKIDLTFLNELTSLTIDPKHVEIVEDLVIAAVNEAGRKVKDSSGKKLSAITAGIKIPEGFGGNLTGQ